MHFLKIENRKGIYLALGFAASLFLLFTTLLIPDFISELELKTYDLRMKIQENQEIYQDLLLIDIDDRSIGGIGRWPWDRSVHAGLLDSLAKSGTGTIIYDILFDQPSKPDEDALLVDATDKGKKVFYPVGFKFTRQETDGDNKVKHPDLAEVKAHGFGKLIGKNRLLSVSRMISPIKNLIGFAKGLGHISANRDSDGIIRRVPLLVKLEGTIFPSLALVAALDYLNVRRDNLEINLGKHILIKNALFPGEATRRSVQIPVDDRAMMLIHYPGPWQKTFTHLSFKKVIDSFASGKVNKGELEDKLIIISNAASGFDVKPVPLEKAYPGGGIHASILNTILMGNFLQDAGLITNLFIGLCLGISGACIGMVRGWSVKITLIGFLAAAYFYLSLLAFSMGVVLDFILPILSAFFALLLVSLYQVSEEKAKNQALSRKNRLAENGLKEVGIKIELQDKKIQYLMESLSSKQWENSSLSARLNSEREYKEKLEQKKINLVSTVIRFDLKELRSEAAEYNIITKSSKLLEAFELAKKVADTDHAVFIFGESGTGKELLAEAIVKMSKRSKNSFVKINVANLNFNLADSTLFGHKKGAFTGADKEKPGLFKEAHSGTLFLDEIALISADIQPKLLRVLQSNEIVPVGSSKPEYVNVRLITATDGNLGEMVKRNEFSLPLWERLSVYPITLPPLRERSGDIPDLVEVLIKRHKGEKEITGISQDALSCLCESKWPGNVRQLENVVIRAIINTKNRELTADDIGFAMAQGKNMGTCEEKPERDLSKKNDAEKQHQTPEKDRASGAAQKDILNRLREAEFAINKAANLLGIGRNTLTDNFKGICFKYLAVNNFDRNRAAMGIAGNNALGVKVEKKIAVYQKNILQIVSECESAEKAREQSRRKFKNIPNEYFEYIYELIDREFDGERH